MAAFDPQARLQRLEQQLEAFERLHGDELRELQRRLEAYQRLHEDEVRLLREEIADLRAALSGDAAPPQPPNPGGSPRWAEPGASVTAAAGGTEEGQAPVTPNPADDPEVVQEAVEEAVEASLQQTVSRRELFGRGRADDAE
jgi:hypothetical protein